MSKSRKRKTHIHAIDPRQLQLPFEGVLDLGNGVNAAIGATRSRFTGSRLRRTKQSPPQRMSA